MRALICLFVIVLVANVAAPLLSRARPKPDRAGSDASAAPRSRPGAPEALVWGPLLIGLGFAFGFVLTELLGGASWLVAGRL